MNNDICPLYVSKELGYSAAVARVLCTSDAAVSKYEGEDESLMLSVPMHRVNAMRYEVIRITLHRRRLGGKDLFFLGFLDLPKVAVGPYAVVAEPGDSLHGNLDSLFREHFPEASNENWVDAVLARLKSIGRDIGQ
jgi:hypothetical protein